MNDEQVAGARESAVRHRVKRRVRIRVEQPSAVPVRRRAMKLWEDNSRAFVAAMILVLGIATIWLSLSLFVGEAIPRSPR
jgi:hypothetical protein